MQDFTLSDSEDQSFRNKIMIDNNNNDEESDEIINTFMKKSKQMLLQYSSIWMIDESKFESFIFIIIFNCNLISFDVD